MHVHLLIIVIAFYTLQICNQHSLADICIYGDASLFRRAQRTGIRVVTSKVYLLVEVIDLLLMFLTFVLSLDQWVFDSIAAMKLEDDGKYTVAEPFGTPAKTPIKSRRAAVSGLEAHSTVSE